MYKEHSVNRIERALEALVERIDTPAPIVLVDVMQERGVRVLPNREKNAALP